MGEPDRITNTKGVILMNTDLVPQTVAANQFGRKRQWVNTLIKRGKIKSHLVHGKKWVSLKEIEAWEKGKEKVSE